MVIGQIGPHGLIARLPAMLDYERRQEPAPIQDQTDLEIIVMAMLASIPFAKRTPALIQVGIRVVDICFYLFITI